MANPLKCDLCSKSATVHLTQIVNNKVHKVDLCEECAQAKGVTDPSGFSLADLLLKASLNADCDGQAGLQELAGNATLLFYQTEEAREGQQAFLEKRAPDFDKFKRLP